MADVAETILIYEKEPQEPGAHFYLLLAYDGEGNEVGRKMVGGWGDDAAGEPGRDPGGERRWVCLL
jgi:hypothetical protein